MTLDTAERFALGSGLALTYRKEPRVKGKGDTTTEQVGVVILASRLIGIEKQLNRRELSVAQTSVFQFTTP
jgi:hypothetical protein